MIPHLLQAQHNRKFASRCDSAFPDNYFDWKSTVLFYSALHLVKAFIENEGYPAGHMLHTDIEKTIYFDSSKYRDYSPRIPFAKNAYQSYKTLRTNSENARYHCVFLSINATVQHQKNLYRDSIRALTFVESFLEDKGVTCKSIPKHLIESEE